MPPAPELPGGLAWPGDGGPRRAPPTSRPCHRSAGCRRPGAGPPRGPRCERRPGAALEKRATTALFCSWGQENCGKVRSETEYLVYKYIYIYIYTHTYMIICKHVSVYNM